ncbi:MAG: hypothetical protein BWY83_02128 [bacterium ADurb.Bin478]|nr:MAG: hypothetical protein BWY83_02128 [bacterium ADurb.Bin478]
MSRPMTGSSFPSRACWVRSREYFSRLPVKQKLFPARVVSVSGCHCMVTPPFCNRFRMSRFSAVEKKSTTLRATCGPISWMLSSSSSPARASLSKLAKCFTSTRLKCSPTKRRPRPKRTRSSGRRRLASMACSRFFADFPAMRSRPARSFSWRKYRSLTSFTSFFSTSCSTSFSPSPSMSMAFLLLKWIMRSRSCAGQARLMQRRAASPSGRTVRLPHSGQVSGSVNFFSAPLLREAMDLTTSGITSPARCTSTQSPSRMSLRSISSWLCRVARLTSTPPIFTGFITATGVSTPVRPTCTMISTI